MNNRGLVYIVCIYTVKPAYNGHPWKMARSPLYTGRLLYTGQICRKYKATENLTVIYSRGDHYVQGCILIFFNQYNDSACFSQSRINQIEHSGCLMSATLNPTVWTQFCTASGLWLLDTSLNRILFFNRVWQVIVSLINDMVKAHEL